MNEQLQNAVSNLITQSISAFQQGATFLNEQIPDVIHQLLLWKAIESFLYFFIVGIIGTIVFIYLNYKQYKFWMNPDKTGWNEGEPRITGDGGPLVMLNTLQIVILIFLYNAITNLDWLQIWIAPKLYLIEYAKTFIK